MKTFYFVIVLSFIYSCSEGLEDKSYTIRNISEHNVSIKFYTYNDIIENIIEIPQANSISKSGNVETNPFTNNFPKIEIVFDNTKKLIYRINDINLQPINNIFLFGTENNGFNCNNNNCVYTISNDDFNRAQ